MASAVALFGSPLGALVGILLGTGAIWIGSDFLETAAERLSVAYGLPAVVQGSIVVAVGSSTPELASVVVAGLAGVFDLGVGAIVGSAIFNVLVIPAAARLAVEQPLSASREIVYKEAQFYMLAVSAIVVTFALAVIYVPVPGGPPLDGQFTRPLAAIPLLLYGLYLFIQWQDVADYDAVVETDSIAVRREWLKLAAGLGAILLGVEGLVGGVKSLSLTFGVPTFLTGVTVVAAATSLPDLLVSVRAADAARAETSLGNVFGSNTFDLLVALPVGVLLVGTVTVDFAVAAPMLGVLTLATVLLFGLLRTKLSLTHGEAVSLLGAYGIFLVWILAETVGWIDLLRPA
jgi:cation:H+ antiporter